MSMILKMINTKTSSTSWDDNIKHYLILLYERSKDLDNINDVRKLTKDRLIIRNSPISFSQDYILSKRYRELHNKTQKIYYSSKFILSPSKQAPSEIILLCQRIIQSSKDFLNAFSGIDFSSRREVSFISFID